MKPTNLLLLNFPPFSKLGSDLRTILLESLTPEIQLHEENVERPSGRHLTDVLCRIKPAVTFLISQFNPSRPVQTVLDACKADETEPPIIVVTEENEPDEVFATLKLGAVDFITAPLKPINILPRLRRILASHLFSLPESIATQHKLIGQSPTFLSEVSKIPLVAKCDAGVMISGETGTGKELCARAIHNLSPRAGQPFIPVNCGAIPVELAENELFGHERGAYTGAATTKPGLIQEADGGTLFLDELDSLPLLAQVKLLRFLQEREYRPLGSTRTRYADVRVVAATNVDFEKAIKTGHLRQDLYFRLNIIPITLPPLRQRIEDIRLLADYFRIKYAVNYNKHVTSLSPNALQKLALYDWPGNVRELEHVIQRAVALCKFSTLRAEDIQFASFTQAAVVESFKQAKNQVIQQFERNYLQSLLLAYNGNISRAADAAQKNRRAFWELLRKHHIDVQQFAQKTGTKGLTN
ncbi:MAG TPA: sigma-54 dependent transcriptional regulator [Blastocatellia bacterium]|nr:sigma-54 dependent transcriptional regulator [Blastocatellia bacterium]